jgi:hypothetical protein
MRPKDLRQNSTPGPSDYDIERKIERPAYSISQKTGKEVENTNPCPAAYSPSVRHPSPAYSIKGMVKVTEKMLAPQYRMIPSTICQGPKFTMKQRGDARRFTTDTPVPAYVPTLFGSDSTYCRVGVKLPSRKIEVTPGTADYQSITKTPTSGASFHQRIGGEMVGDSPGLAAYYPEYQAVMNTKKSNPKNNRCELK